MPFRLGMLGAWHVHATGMVRQIAAHPEEFTLVAIHEPDSVVAAGRQSDWHNLLPGVRWHDHLTDLWDESLDGVLVEGRITENLARARLALERDLPVLLEKPAGTRLQDFVELVHLARARKLHLQVAYLFRYVATIQELVRLAKEGELGDLYYLRARLPKDRWLYRELESDLQPYPGGIFFEMAGHLVDLAIALFGKPLRIEPFLAHHHPDAGTFMDHGIAVLTFAHGHAVVEANVLEVVPGTRRIELYGSKGACVIPHLGSGHLANHPVQGIEVFKEGDTAWQRLEFPATTLQIADLREFAACVRKEKAPDFTLEHDLQVQEALLVAAAPAACAAVNSQRDAPTRR